MQREQRQDGILELDASQHVVRVAQAPGDGSAQWRIAEATVSLRRSAGLIRARPSLTSSISTSTPAS